MEYRLSVDVAVVRWVARNLFQRFFETGGFANFGFQEFYMWYFWIRISGVDAEIRFRLFIKLTKFVGTVQKKFTVIMDLGARNGDGI